MQQDQYPKCEKCENEVVHGYHYCEPKKDA